MIVVLCTAFRGGMRAVVEGYQRDGVFERWNATLVLTHDEVPALAKMRMALGAYLRFLKLLRSGQVTAVHSHVAMRVHLWSSGRRIFISKLSRPNKWNDSGMSTSRNH